MNCTSPLFRLRDSVEPFMLKEGGAPPSLIKRKFLNSLDYFSLVNDCGINPNYYQRIPCGQCVNCRLNHAKMWAARCMLEARCHEVNYFITLTYDDVNLPFSSIGLPTLRKRDVTLFLKRFRKKYGSVRFFMSGEYGDSTFRPHYHMLLFGSPEFDDLSVYKLSRSGKNIYPLLNSPSLESVWGKGFVVIERLTPENAAYTARYTLKKVGFSGYSPERARMALQDMSCYSDSEVHSILECAGFLEPVFCNMSRRPGIAREFYEQYKDDIVNLLEIPYTNGVRSIRYFEKLIDEEFPLKSIERSDLKAALGRDFVGDVSEFESLIAQDRLARKKRERKMKV